MQQNVKKQWEPQKLRLSSLPRPVLNMSTEFQLKAVRPIHEVQTGNCLHKEEVLEFNERKASDKAIIQLTLRLFICLKQFFI